MSSSFTYESWIKARYAAPYLARRHIDQDSCPAEGAEGVAASLKRWQEIREIQKLISYCIYRERKFLWSEKMSDHVHWHQIIYRSSQRLDRLKRRFDQPQWCATYPALEKNHSPIALRIALGKSPSNVLGLPKKEAHAACVDGNIVPPKRKRKRGKTDIKSKLSRLAVGETYVHDEHPECIGDYYSNCAGSDDYADDIFISVCVSKGKYALVSGCRNKFKFSGYLLPANRQLTKDQYAAAKQAVEKTAVYLQVENQLDQLDRLESQAKAKGVLIKYLTE